MSPRTDTDVPADPFAVRETPARYALALDQHDPAALTDVLTEDATWTFTLTGTAGTGPITGREAILDFVRRATDGQSDRRRHHLTNVVVRSADAGAAVVQAYLMLTSNAGGVASVVMTGRYTFGLRHVDDAWRIAELLLDLDNAES